MHLFDNDIQLIQDGRHRYAARVSGNWSINKTPNGGYLLALLAEAALGHSAKANLAILTANFIARTIPGPAVVTIESMGATRNFDRWQVSLFQEQAETLRSMVTLMADGAASAGTRYEKTAPDLAGRDLCIKFGQMPGYTLFDHMEVLLDPGCAGWINGELADRSELRGWTKFTDDRPWDPAALMLIADAFPPPIFRSQGMVAWVPTLEMSVNIRNLPQTRWLKCVFRSRFLNGGMVEEDGEIWDAGGELVAISRQVAQYRKA